MSTTTTYTFDKSGRMTKQYNSSEAHYFTYNQRNMVKQIQDVKSVSPNPNRYFTYNGVGERVFGIDGTSTPSYWTYDAGKLLNERQGSLVARYRHNDTAQDCPLGSCVEREDEFSTLLSPTFDGTGSIQQMASVGSGTLSYEYSRFGETLATGNTGLEESLPNRFQAGAAAYVMALATTENIYVGPAGMAFLLTSMKVHEAQMSGVDATRTG